MYKFERLKVWQESLTLSKMCYRIAVTFPAYEKSALSDQLRRAATSITLNIAEGSGSDSEKDFTRFLLLARKSLFEVLSILKIAEEIHNIRNLEMYYDQCDLVGKLLNGLINKLKAKSK